MRRLRLAAVLLAVFAATQIQAGSALAATSNGACGTLATPDPSGSPGTAGDPCLISSDADLDTALQTIDADTAHTGASTLDYELTTDLDYAKDSSNTTGAATANWKGIDWFSGTFNGDGHTISNLNYTTDSFTATLPGGDVAAGDNLGLFRVLNGATVENLTLDNVHANNSATDNLSVAGVSVWSFDSTVTGVALTDPTIFDGPGGGDNYVGGLVSLAYANSYADDGSTTADGGTTTFTNNSVTGGSIADYNRTGGIVGMATGPTTVADNYVDSTLSNPGHPVAGAGGQANTFFYVIGGLVGEVGATYTTSGGAQAAGVSMTDNVIGGTIKGLSTDHRSNDGVNFASATVGYASTPGSPDSSATNWSTSNDLVFSDISYTNETGSGVPGADGTLVSPQTLATESTYTGTDTGLTDSATQQTFDDLGWNFGAADPSGWAWSGSPASGSPTPQTNAGLTVQHATITELVNTVPSDAALLADAGAAATLGTPTIDASGVDWTTDGSYTATVGVTGAISDPIPVTVVVASSFIRLADSAPALQVTATAPSPDTVVKALGATVAGGSGSPAVDISQVDFTTPGTYPVTVTDTNPDDGSAPVTATVRIVPVSIVTVKTQTLHFNVANPPTAQQVQTAAGAVLTDAQGDSVQGTLSADVSQVGKTPGSYTATITGTDQFGFTTQPAKITVVISNAAIAIAHGTVTFQAGNAPSQAAVLGALGATVTGSGSGPLAADLSNVDFEDPGTYTVTVTDTNFDDVAADQPATVVVVPVTFVNLASANVYVQAGPDSSLPPATLMADAGAALTDLYHDDVTGTLTADTSGVNASVPGIYTATISATDQYGFDAGPQRVNVVVYEPAVTTGSVIVAGTLQAGRALTAQTFGWPSLAPLQYQWLVNGTPVPGATSSAFTIPTSAKGEEITVTVTEAPQYYQAASVTSAAVTVPGTAGPAGPGGPGGPPPKKPGPRIPSAAMVREALKRAVGANRAAIARALKGGHLGVAFSAPGAGRLKLGWYAEIATNAGTHRKPGAKPNTKVSTKPSTRKVLIASATTSFSKAKRGSVVVRLNSQGRTLLKVAKTLKLVLQVSFSPTGGKATTLSRTLTLDSAAGPTRTPPKTR